jgi:hypothetical protein
MQQHWSPPSMPSLAWCVHRGSVGEPTGYQHDREALRGVGWKRWVGLWDAVHQMSAVRAILNSRSFMAHGTCHWFVPGAWQGWADRRGIGALDVRLCLDYVDAVWSGDSSLLCMQSSSWW